MSYVLVLNSGSSSIKFQLVDPTANATDAPLVSGLVEQVGEPSGAITIKVGGEKITEELEVPDHSFGLKRAFDLMDDHQVGTKDVDIIAVGHRVVHGGRLFSEPQLIEDQIESMIEDLIPLAPLHNPANLDGIRVARKILPDIPHVAVFDTASSIPCRRPQRCMPSIARLPPSTISAATASTAPHTSSSPSKCRRSWTAIRSTRTRSRCTWAMAPLRRPSAMAAPSIPRWA